MKKIFYFTLIIFLMRFEPLWSQEPLQEITVNSGDTMWSIANKYLKDPQKWPELVKYNDQLSSDPTIALPGTKIKVPVLLIKEEYRNAELVTMIPEVRYKRKGEEEWKTAKEKLILKYEDTLRTMKGAQARVKFPSKEIIQINENSLVVLKPEKILQEVQLLQGDVRASKAKVIMPSGMVVKPKSTNSDFQARVRSDETEVVYVYKGKVDVTAQGKTITVPEGFGTEVPKSSPPQTPVPLARIKDFHPEMMKSSNISPPEIKQNNGTIVISPPTQKENKKETETGKSKSILAQGLLSNYKFQISSDEKFEKVLMEKMSPTGEALDIKKQNIPDGEYYLRVAFVDALGIMGAYSVPSKINKDSQAPKLTLETPSDGQKFSGLESFCDVYGTVEGAVAIEANGKIIFIGPNGKFSQSVSLSEGINNIKIVAKDSAGNLTTIVRKVFYSKN
ncbi:MAG: LysM peptidoglycan-binding domain-containing protein [Elusimicrobiota bacterium]